MVSSASYLVGARLLIAYTAWPVQLKQQAVGGRAAATVCSCPSHPPMGALRRPADGNVAAVSHGQHVLTPTAAAA